MRIIGRPLTRPAARLTRNLNDLTWGPSQGRRVEYKSLRGASYSLVNHLFQESSNRKTISSANMDEYSFPAEISECSFQQNEAYPFDFHINPDQVETPAQDFEPAEILSSAAQEWESGGSTSNLVS
jgi:hypothetical protein